MAFVVVGLVLWAAAFLSVSHLPREPGDPKDATYGTNVIVDTWVHWDGSWYDTIARDGYSYTPGQQSSVAFWPSYPLVLRAIGIVIPNISVVGVFVTVLSGFAAVLLFHRWCRLKLSIAAANTAVALLVVYPYAWYLFGPVYADALCLAAALAAFLALERDHLWLAAMAGMLASAARPVGAIVAVALVIRLVEMRRASGTPLCRRDAPVLLALPGWGPTAPTCGSCGETRCCSPRSSPLLAGSRARGPARGSRCGCGTTSSTIPARPRRGGGWPRAPWPSRSSSCCRASCVGSVGPTACSPSGR